MGSGARGNKERLAENIVPAMVSRLDFVFARYLSAKPATAVSVLRDYPSNVVVSAIVGRHSASLAA